MNIQVQVSDYNIITNSQEYTAYTVQSTLPYLNGHCNGQCTPNNAELHQENAATYDTVVHWPTPLSHGYTTSQGSSVFDLIDTPFTTTSASFLETIPVRKQLDNTPYTPTPVAPMGFGASDKTAPYNIVRQLLCLETDECGITITKLNDLTITEVIKTFPLPATVKIFDASWAKINASNNSLIPSLQIVGQSVFVAPVNHGDHWVLAIAYVGAKLVYWADSLPGKRATYTATMDCILKKHETWLGTGWEHRHIQCQQQEEEVSCGLFTIRNLLL